MDAKAEMNARYGKAVEAIQRPTPSKWITFWFHFTETRFSWLDVFLAMIIVGILPGLIMAVAMGLLPSAW